MASTGHCLPDGMEAKGTKIMDTQEITLSGGQVYITQNGENAIRICSGSVLVFAVPYNGETAGRRCFLHEAHAGEVVPSFRYRDPDFREWRFCLEALDTAGLCLMEQACTSVLRRKFLARVPIADGGTGGFEERVVDYYRTKNAREDGLIYKMRQDRKRIREEIRSKTGYEGQGTRDGNASVWENDLYKAVRYVCSENDVEIADFFRIRERTGRKAGLREIAEASGFFYRKIRLEGNWWKKDCGSLLVRGNDGNWYGCVPAGHHSCRLYDPRTGSVRTLDKKAAGTFRRHAFRLLWPFPNKGLEPPDIAEFARKGLRMADALWLLCMDAVCAVAGLAMLKGLGLMLDWQIPEGDRAGIIRTAMFFCGMTALIGMASACKARISLQIEERLAERLSHAMYDRLYRMTNDVYRAWGSDRLARMAFQADGMARNAVRLADTCISSALFLVVSMMALSSLSKDMAWLGLLCVLCCGSLSMMELLATEHGRGSGRAHRASMRARLWESVRGITKIRIAGAEDGTVYQYIRRLSEVSRRMGRIHAAKERLRTAQTAAVFLSLFVACWRLVSVGLARPAAFGSCVEMACLCCVTGWCAYALASAMGEMDRLARYGRKLVRLLQHPVDEGDGGILSSRLLGDIELNDVHFRYEENGPERIAGASLTIHEGEFVGIAGKSGSGKSTLLRLIMGFEKPSEGKVFYHNVDISNLDKRILRRSFGTVLQKEKLFNGSIYDNIVVTAGERERQSLNDVIRTVGLEEDLQSMPMGLETQVGENAGFLSGGQVQKILLARAFLSKPGIFFLDEAASSLDRLSQKRIVQELEQMDVTRIVVSHSPEMLQSCGRILVLDGGRIAEEGSFAELMEKQGLFYQMACGKK